MRCRSASSVDANGPQRPREAWTCERRARWLLEFRSPGVPRMYQRVPGGELSWFCSWFERAVYRSRRHDVGLESATAGGLVSKHRARWLLMTRACAAEDLGQRNFT